MCVVAILVIALGTSGPGQTSEKKAPPLSKAEQELIGMERELSEALVRSDTAALDAFGTMTLSLPHLTDGSLLRRSVLKASSPRLSLRPLWSDSVAMMRS